jgi:hypothetical protein
VCGKNLNIVSICAVSPVVHTSNISSCQKNFFSFPVAVNNSIKVGPLVLLLYLFVITENIMKRPVGVCMYVCVRACVHVCVKTGVFVNISVNLGGKREINDPQIFFLRNNNLFWLLV